MLTHPGYEHNPGIYILRDTGPVRLSTKDPPGLAATAANPLNREVRPLEVDYAGAGTRWASAIAIPRRSGPNATNSEMTTATVPTTIAIARP